MAVDRQGVQPVNQGLTVVTLRLHLKANMTCLKHGDKTFGQ